MAEEEEVYAGELQEEVEGELEGDAEEQGGQGEQEEQGGAEAEEVAPKAEEDDAEKVGVQCFSDCDILTFLLQQLIVLMHVKLALAPCWLTLVRSSVQIPRRFHCSTWKAWRQALPSSACLFDLVAKIGDNMLFVFKIQLSRSLLDSFLTLTFSLCGPVLSVQCRFGRMVKLRAQSWLSERKPFAVRIRFGNVWSLLPEASTTGHVRFYLLQFNCRFCCSRIWYGLLVIV
jgi:hypothetical protein